MLEPNNASRSDRSGVVLRRVRSETKAGDDKLKVTLFRGTRGGACGWYIGPLAADDGWMSLPYLPKSDETIASVAIVRAIGIGKKARIPVCLVDPDDLWDMVWQA